MKRISAGGAVLLLVSVLAMLFSLTFAYRWYEGHQAADRVWKDGRCLNASIESINDGKYCPANARLTRENADRDLRFALVGVAVTVIAGGAAFVMTRKNEGSTPAHYDEIDPNTRGHRRDLS
ncbi:MAG: hypothetical protein M3132_13570, partial [Actinomycetia bacterium]|nr:hypothetical protein [Actinomycetes bacterium]